MQYVNCLLSTNHPIKKVGGRNPLSIIQDTPPGRSNLHHCSQMQQFVSTNLETASATRVLWLIARLVILIVLKKKQQQNKQICSYNLANIASSWGNIRVVLPAYLAATCLKMRLLSTYWESRFVSSKHGYTFLKPLPSKSLDPSNHPRLVSYNVSENPGDHINSVFFQRLL